MWVCSVGVHNVGGVVAEGFLCLLDERVFSFMLVVFGGWRRWEGERERSANKSQDTARTQGGTGTTIRASRIHSKTQHTYFLC
jgi:hypothetical protein